jgi:outer membrane receptor protein involved in Fe transport
MKKNNKIFTLAIFAAISLFFVTASMAQTPTTGAIDGTVVDTAGAVVPGVTVLLAGPNMIRPQTSTTSGDGSFRFSLVPPGRYVLTTEVFKGFAAYRQEAVEVNLEKTTTVTITLVGQNVGATVDVVADAAIDQNSNVSGSSITTDFFSNIPTGRTVQSLYTLAPTVARSGLRDASGRDRDPSVGGSSGPENSYILDGVNTTDPAFGGGGANIPFEFVQEVQVKTGGMGADTGLSTGGVFNVITKSGTNQFHGDVFGYFNTKGLVRETKNFPLTGLAPNGFSEIDAGFDLGGPIVKDRLWFFGAFNPQWRTNHFLTQSFRAPVESDINTPFWSGKITWAVNNSNTFTASHFADYTKEEGHLFAGSGFGANLNSFRGTRETGGTNYAFRWNSAMGNNFIGEYSAGLHFQRNNVIPDSSVAATALVTDNFAILTSAGAVASVTQTGINAPSTNIGRVDFAYSPNGSLQRNFVRDGFGLFQDQTRNRWEAAARMQYIYGMNTFKFGFEYYQNIYDINQVSTGPSGVFANPLAVAPGNGSNPDNVTVSGYRVTNNFTVCTTRVIGGVATPVCPSVAAMNAFNALPIASRPAALTANAVCTTSSGATCVAPVANLTTAEALNNPFLIRGSTRVRDFKLVADTTTAVQGIYFQDDIKVHKNLQINVGIRFDFQQAKGNDGVDYLKLNNWKDNAQPRIGFIWDFTGKGKGKIYANYARYLETPIPLDVNVRAGSDNTQTDKNFNVNTLNAPLTATVATGFATVNLGAHATHFPVDLRPQTVNEVQAGLDYEVAKDLVLGFRGIYRPQGSVIEDGSYDDGNCYFLFNPGETGTQQIVDVLQADGCLNGPGQPTSADILAGGDPFGRARRYYRALEFTASKRFSNNYSFVASYVFSSLIGNYEGLFRNDNGQSDPNITSLFDLPSLLTGLYGRLPNDRPHQFKFNGTYTSPFRLVFSGNFYVQSGIPFNMLVPHPIYGNNEGFGVPRGTAIIPNLGANSAGVESAVGGSRTPTTWNLDLGFYYPIAVGEGKQIKLTADWFNVTNSQRAVTTDNTFSINSGVGGVPAIPNPFWGSGQIFQYPSAFRFGAKFIF